MYHGGIRRIRNALVIMMTLFFACCCRTPWKLWRGRLCVKLAWRKFVKKFWPLKSSRCVLRGLFLFLFVCLLDKWQTERNVQMVFFVPSRPWGGGGGVGGVNRLVFYWCLYGCRSLKTNLKIFVLCCCPYDCRPTLKATLKVFVFYLGLYDCRLFWRQTSRSLLRTCLVFIYGCRLTLKTTPKIFVSHLCLWDFTPTLKTALKIFVSYLCLRDSTPTSKTALGIVVLYLCLCDCTPTLKTFLKMFISYFVHQPSRSLFHTCLCDSTPTLKTAHKIFASYLSVWLHTYTEDFSQDVYFVLCPFDCRPTLKTTLEISRCSVTTKLWAQPGCQRHWKMSQTMQVGWSVGWVHVCVWRVGVGVRCVCMSVWYMCVCVRACVVFWCGRLHVCVGMTVSV